VRGEARPVDLARRRRRPAIPDGLVRLVLYRGPVALVLGIHASPEHAGVDLRTRFERRFLQILVDRLNATSSLLAETGS